MIAKKVSWVGCQGSEPHFRGFPCSLWVLFHFLTVQAAGRNVDHMQETGESAASAQPFLPPLAPCCRPVLRGFCACR